MSYATVRTRFSVGDVVFFRDVDDDAVHRGAVVGIEAFCDKPGYSPDFEVTYRVIDKWASTPARAPFMLAEKDLHSNADDAFPPVPPDALEEPPTLAIKLVPVPYVDDGGPL